MPSVKRLADDADMIVNGYAFYITDMGYKIINLGNPLKSVNLSFDNDLLETTMDDIEISIVKKYLRKNKKYLEINNA